MKGTMLLSAYDIGVEYLQHGHFFRPSIWAKYDMNFMDISYLIKDFNGMKVTTEFITNKKIKDYIDGRKKEWKHLINSLNDADDVDENLSIKLNEIREQIETDVNQMVIETIWTMKNISNYKNAVYSVMRIRNDSIFEALIKAKKIT